MVKKYLKLFVFSLMLVCASVFSLAFNSQMKVVRADEINQIVSLTSNVSSTDFVKGTVEGYGEYPVGSTVTLTASPVEGCHFVCWKDEGGNVLSNNNPYSFEISQDTKVDVEFDFTQYEVICNLNNFTISEITYSYDNLRFDDANIASYERATIVDNQIEGKFYYNDIVSLKYVLSNNTNFVKELSSSNFIMSKTITMISADSEGNIIWTETDGEKDASLVGQSVDSFNFQCDEFDYVIVTNVKVGSKYIAKSLEFKTKVKKDVNIIVAENVIKVIEFTAKLLDGGEHKDLDMAEIEDAITFNYGYYGKIENIAEFTGLVNTNRYYLVEPNANYKLTLTDNLDYEYIQTNSNIDRVIQGYFDSSISGFTFLYQRRGYQIVFEQIVKSDEGYETADVNWSNLSSLSTYAGNLVKVEFVDDKFEISINGVSTYTINPSDEIFGFNFFGFSKTASLDEGNSSIEHIIDEANPAGTTIYVVLTKVQYNFTFGVADTSKEFNQYFTNRVTNLPQNGIYCRLDNISLTASVPVGFKTGNWLIKEGTEITELTQTNFTFIPSSNNTNVEVLLIIEYEYIEFSFELEGKVGENQYVANISVAILDKFTINEDGTMLAVWGDFYKLENQSGTAGDWSYNGFVKSTANSTEDILVFTSNIGDVFVYLTDGQYEYLTFSGLKYFYNGNNFRRFSETSREPLSYTPFDTDCGLKVSNVCVDDYIFASSSLKAQYANDYRFLHFVKQGSNITLPEKSSDGYAIYGSNYYINSAIVVKYVKRNGNVSVTSGNENAFKTSKFEFDFLGTQNYITEDIYYNLEIQFDGTYQTNNVSIKIKKSEVTLGYSFVGFVVKYSDGTHDNHFYNDSTNIKDDDNYYSFQFTYESEYKDSIITANFEEIVYEINIDASVTAGVFVTDNENNDLLENGSFILTWSVLGKVPTITVVSRDGYYIANAYFVSTENVIGELIGVETTQTNNSLELNDDIFEEIIKLADSNNELILYLVEEGRLFNIVVQYVTEQDVDGFYFKDAEITCTYDTTEITSSATASIGQSSTIYCIKLDRIRFNTVVKLSINDSNIEGLYFENWIFEGNVVDEDKDYEFEVLGDMYIYANFVGLDYTISFEYLNSDKEDYADITSGASFTVNDSSDSYFNIGDNIGIKIVEKTGYRLIGAYYSIGANDYSIFEGLVTSVDIFYYTIEEFLPSDYLLASRDEQISSSTAKNFVIKLIFEEKVYSISSVVENITIHKKNVINTTGVEKDNWVNVTSIKYLVNGQYEEKAPNDDGYVYYSTNSSIQISFNNALPGISLKALYLGGNIYTIESLGETNIARQTVTLTMEQINGLDYYILNFSLNSEILETVGNDSNFKISFVYEIKRYLMTFTTNTINNVLLGKKYELVLSYKPTDTTFGGSKSEKTKGVLKNSTNLQNSTMFYGVANTWTILYDTDKNNGFDEYYSFVYFVYYLGGKEYRFKPDVIGGNSFDFGLERTYKDQNGDEFVLWDLIANNTQPTIYAFYEPKITLSDSFVYLDDQYIKTVGYNGEAQYLTSSYNTDVVDPDIKYATEVFGGIEIFYTNAQGMSIDPINSNTYNIRIKVAGISFSEEVFLVINKLKLSVNHVGTISKEYDGSDTLLPSNVYELKNQFSLSGLVGTDIGQLDLNNINGYFADFKVGKNIDVTVNSIRLGATLLSNYYIVDGADQVMSVTLKEIGEITKKELTINVNSFTFYNIVYKENVDYVLKYVQNSELTFNEVLAGSDECFIDSSKLVFTLNDYSIGYGKNVTVNLSEALDGADKDNYFINNIFYNIDIHPYEIVCEHKNLGKFTITDYDELCVIPVDIKTDSLVVEIINNGHPEYPELFELVENHMRNNEKFNNFYRYNVTTIYGNTVNISKFLGAYVTFKDVKNMSSLYNINLEAKKLDINKTNNTVKVKIGENTGNTFCIMTTKSYFAIWKIILIVGLSLLLLLIIIICIIVYKKIRAKKADAKHKI